MVICFNTLFGIRLGLQGDDMKKICWTSLVDKQHQYSMGGLPLDNVTEEKDLGVTVTDSFKSSTQCSIAAAKANRILGIIKKTFSCRDGIVLSKLYKSLVRPHLEYCIQAWNPYLQRDIDTLEKVQRRATKMMSGLEKVPYEERLKRLNLTTLKTRRIRGDLIEVFKVFKGLDDLRSCMYESEVAGLS